MRLNQDRTLQKQYEPGKALPQNIQPMTEKEKVIRNIKLILQALCLPGLIIALVLFFASCTTYEVVLMPEGKVIQVDGNRALIQFPSQSGNNSGVSWFYMPGSIEGDKILIVRP